MEIFIYIIIIIIEPNSKTMGAINTTKPTNPILVIFVPVILRLFVNNLTNQQIGDLHFIP